MALINKLSAIGNAIREKTGGTELMTLDAMPDEIRAIVSGGSELPEEAFVVTGNCTYRFANKGWDWFIEKFGNQITTQNIGEGANMFVSSGVTRIPFEINCATNNNYSYSNMFSGCLALEEISTINDMSPMSINSMFENCQQLRKLPEFKNFDTSKLLSYNYSNVSSLFKGCNCLREIDFDTLKLFINPLTTSSYNVLYNGLASYCTSLDSLKLPVILAAYTGNTFNQTVAYCTRLKNFTFETNEDGSPIAANWKSQAIDCSSGVGYASPANVANLLRNPDMTNANKIIDDASYQALKNHPDSWTMDEAYSRYNHDSAVETINSLPDCSASGSPNTIKFKGAAGSKTDGGAINTLTETEIAVATAKGWTVSFV
jgi:hypothetical protein